MNGLLLFTCLSVVCVVRGVPLPQQEQEQFTAARDQFLQRDQQTQLLSGEEQAPRQGRDFGDLAKILSIAGAEAQEVDPSGSYSGRKRRQTLEADNDSLQTDAVVDGSVEVAEEDQAPRSGRDFGDIAKILAIAGTGPKPVDLQGGYTGRKRRAATLANNDVKEVSLKSVKVKPYGKNGALVHSAVDGATISRTIFDEAFSG